MEQGGEGSKRLTTSTATSTASAISTASAVSAATTTSATVSCHLSKSGINLLLCLSKNSNQITSLLLICKTR